VSVTGPVIVNGITNPSQSTIVISEDVTTSTSKLKHSRFSVVVVVVVGSTVVVLVVVGSTVVVVVVVGHPPAQLSEGELISTNIAPPVFVLEDKISKANPAPLITHCPAVKEGFVP
jgi:hypothetical protein